MTRADASELQHATGFVFSLDDLQTGWEPDLWADMLNFVKNPSSSNIRLSRGDHAEAGHRARTGSLRTSGRHGLEQY